MLNDTRENEYRIHGVESPLPPSYNKMVDWLYNKTNPTFYEQELRLYMFLKWTREQLLALKIKDSEIL